MEGYDLDQIDPALLQEKETLDRQRTNLLKTYETAKFTLANLVSEQDRIEREDQPKKIISYHLLREQTKLAVEILHDRISKVTTLYHGAIARIKTAQEQLHPCFACENRMSKKIGVDGCNYRDKYTDLKDLPSCPDTTRQKSTIERDRCFRGNVETPQPQPRLS
jgi:hypothetical protein